MVVVAGGALVVVAGGALVVVAGGALVVVAGGATVVVAGAAGSASHHCPLQGPVQRASSSLHQSPPAGFPSQLL